jgi:hypothetical protein
LDASARGRPIHSTTTTANHDAADAS